MSKPNGVEIEARAIGDDLRGLFGRVAVWPLKDAEQPIGSVANGVDACSNDPTMSQTPPSHQTLLIDKRRPVHRAAN